MNYERDGYTFYDGYNAGTGGFVSAAYIMKQYQRFEVQFTNSGGTTPNHSFDVEGSCDGQNWASVIAAAITINTNASTKLATSTHAVPFVRVKLTATSGNVGTVKVLLSSM